MYKKISVAVVGLVVGAFFISHLAYGQGTTSTSTSTTTTTQSTKVTPKAAPKKQAAAKVETTEATVTTTTTPGTLRTVYSEEALKKMDRTLCITGFDAKIGDVKENKCRKATPPDIAYSCVWTKKGPAAYPDTLQGPCNLDFAEHRGNAGYDKVQCCFRAAKGESTTSTSSTGPVRTK